MNELLSENEQFCCFSSSSFNINNFYETKIDYLIILFTKLSFCETILIIDSFKFFMHFPFDDKVFKKNEIN